MVMMVTLDLLVGHEVVSVAPKFEDTLRDALLVSTLQRVVAIIEI